MSAIANASERSEVGRPDSAFALMRLNAVLEMTRTFQAFISKTRDIDRDDADFQFAAQSCHDALTLNLCALRDEVRAGLAEADPEILERGPVQAIFREIESNQAQGGGTLASAGARG